MRGYLCIRHVLKCKCSQLTCIEAHYWTIILGITEPHHPGLVTIFLRTLAGVAKVEIVTNLMELRRDVVAPAILVHRHPRIHVGISDPSKGVVR